MAMPGQKSNITISIQAVSFFLRLLIAVLLFFWKITLLYSSISFPTAVLDPAFLLPCKLLMMMTLLSSTSFPYEAFSLMPTFFLLECPSGIIRTSFDILKRRYYCFRIPVVVDSLIFLPMSQLLFLM